MIEEIFSLQAYRFEETENALQYLFKRTDVDISSWLTAI